MTHQKRREKSLKNFYGIGATIRIDQEIECLPYAGFFNTILTYLV